MPKWTSWKLSSDGSLRADRVFTCCLMIKARSRVSMRCFKQKQKAQRGCFLACLSAWSKKKKKDLCDTEAHTFWRSHAHVWWKNIFKMITSIFFPLAISWSNAHLYYNGTFFNGMHIMYAMLANVFWHSLVQCSFKWSTIYFSIELLFNFHSDFHFVTLWLSGDQSMSIVFNVSGERCSSLRRL